MSLNIQYLLEGTPHFHGGHSKSVSYAAAIAARVGDARRQGSVAAMLRWMRQPLIEGAARNGDRGRSGPDFAAHPRATRSLFQTWAASDLAHTDVAGQLWLALSPN